MNKERIACFLVLVGVVCVYLQVILGNISRRSSSRYVHFTAKYAYLFCNSAGTIAMVIFILADRSTVVWIMSLVVLNNSLVISERHKDIPQLIFTVINMLLVAFKSLTNFIHIDTHHTRIGVVTIVTFIVVCVLCKIFIHRTIGCTDFSEAINKYMESHEFGNANCYDAQTLSSYRYLVEFKLPSTRDGDIPDPRTTLENIYNPSPPPGIDIIDLPGGRKVCLSFAMFRLLLRQYDGIPCYEEKLVVPSRYNTFCYGPRKKARALVTTHLLPADQDDRGRGFRAVEVELAFLHDHIQGGLLVLSSNGLINCCIVLAVLKFLAYIANAVVYAMKTENNVSVAVVLLAVILHLVLDLLHISLYCGSDRWIVSYLSHCCRNQNQVTHTGLLSKLNLCINFIERIWCTNRCIARVHASCRAMWPVGNYWQNKIGQYSLIDDPSLKDEQNIIVRWTRGFLLEHTWQEANPVGLPPHLIEQISHFLRQVVIQSNSFDDAHAHLLANGENPDLQHSLKGVLSLKGSIETPESEEVEIILKWHIATWWCENNPPEVVSEKQKQPEHSDENKTTAKYLSRYCAYLLAFHPNLLPNEARASHTFRKVHKILKGWFQGRNDTGTGWKSTILHDPPNYEGPNRRNQALLLINDGVTIGDHLIGLQRPERWKILANIWVKIVTNIAAPHSLYENKYAENHVKCLAKGGEFLTHLWSILSHACVLKQHPWPREFTNGDRFIRHLVKKYSV